MQVKGAELSAAFSLQRIMDLISNLLEPSASRGFQSRRLWTHTLLHVRSSAECVCVFVCAVTHQRGATSETLLRASVRVQLMGKHAVGLRVKGVDFLSPF